MRAFVLMLQRLEMAVLGWPHRAPRFGSARRLTGTDTNQVSHPSPPTMSSTTDMIRIASTPLMLLVASLQIRRTMPITYRTTVRAAGFTYFCKGVSVENLFAVGVYERQ